MKKTAANRGRTPRTAQDTLRERHAAVEALHQEAIESTLPAKIEMTMRQWFSRVQLEETDAADMMIAATAMALAMELEIATPSPSGATAIDRLARRRRLGPEEQAAAAALRAARFAPLLIRSRVGDGLYAAEDLATRQDFVLFDESLPADSVGLSLFVRLYAIDGAHVGIVGLATLLAPEALAVALDFVRPGRGIPHSHRCAAAVYRYLVRHGGPQVPGLDGMLDEEEEAESTELDLLAIQVLTDGAGPEPTAAILDAVRRLVSPDTILEALFKAARLGPLGKPEAGVVYRRFAEAMIEALHLRAKAGSGADRAPLDRLAAVIADEHATNRYPQEAVDLFNDIRRALAAAKPRQAGDDLTRVIERIRGLRAKTVDQGCTEQEALAAADKVAELLDRYGLSLGETDLRQQACLGVGIDSRRKRSGPLEDVFPSIAHFCDCRCWMEHAPDGTIRSVFFGLPADVEAAQYLYERVGTALDTETAAFRQGDFYRALAGGGRHKATTSFQLGLARGIAAKLAARKAERDAKTFAQTGRDLVPVKASVVEEELAKLGMAFTLKETNRSRMVLRDAFEAGQVASGRFEIQSEIEEARGNAPPAAKRSDLSP